MVYLHTKLRFKAKKRPFSIFHWGHDVPFFLPHSVKLSVVEFQFGVILLIERQRIGKNLKKSRWNILEVFVFMIRLFSAKGTVVAN